MKSTLIIGGARSGKSRFALEMAVKSGGEVLFVATAEAGDEEMKQRIEKHRRSRPSKWRTLEATTHIGDRIAQSIGGAKTVIIDCITLLVNNVIQEHGQPDGEAIDADLIEKATIAEIDRLVRCMEQSGASFIIVTNEVGLGLVPGDRLSRLYRDWLGRANQRLAEHADEVILMVAGVPVYVKPGR